MTDRQLAPERDVGGRLSTALILTKLTARVNEPRKSAAQAYRADFS